MTLDLAVDVLVCFNFQRAARSEYGELLTDQVFLILVGIICIITGYDINYELCAHFNWVSTELQMVLNTVSFLLLLTPVHSSEK